MPPCSRCSLAKCCWRERCPALVSLPAKRSTHAGGCTAWPGMFCGRAAQLPFVIDQPADHLHTRPPCRPHPQLSAAQLAVCPLLLRLQVGAA